MGRCRCKRKPIATHPTEVAAELYVSHAGLVSSTKMPKHGICQNLNQQLSLGNVHLRTTRKTIERILRAVNRVP